MSSLSYEDSKSLALKTILLLALITVIEVAIALVGKGYIGGHDFTASKWGAAIIGLSMIALSLFKAIKIIFEFMHMKYEVPGLATSVLLPTILLIWGVIAFLWEGADQQNRRNVIIEKDKMELEESQRVGALIKEVDASDYR